MIPVKEAVKAAMQFVAETFEGQTLTDPRLEEIEPSDDSAYWYITLSFSRTSPQGSFAAALNLNSGPRDYKTITVDANTGAIKSVKIRQLT